MYILRTEKRSKMRHNSSRGLDVSFNTLVNYMVGSKFRTAIFSYGF